MSRNYITVKVARAGTKTHEVTLNGGRTVEDALKAAELTVKPSEVVYVNDEAIDEDEVSSYELEDGDKVVLVKNINGGRK